MSRRDALSLLVLVVAGILATGTSDSGSSARTERTAPQTVDLNASVKFTGNQFVITNADSFTWSNCKLEVNSKVFSSGYKYEGATLRAGETYTIGAMQFANSDGERFNPFTHKPQSFSLYCDTPRGKGHYYGGWE